MKRIFLLAGAIGWGISILGVLLPWSVMDIVLQNMGATAPVTYDDMALYLAGLSETEHNKALAIHAVLTETEDWSGWTENEARYRRIVNAIFEASETGVPVYL